MATSSSKCLWPAHCTLAESQRSCLATLPGPLPGTVNKDHFLGGLLSCGAKLRQCVLFIDQYDLHLSALLSSYFGKSFYWVTWLGVNKPLISIYLTILLSHFQLYVITRAEVEEIHHHSCWSSIDWVTNLIGEALDRSISFYPLPFRHATSPRLSRGRWFTDYNRL